MRLARLLLVFNLVLPNLVCANVAVVKVSGCARNGGAGEKAAGAGGDGAVAGSTGRKHWASGLNARVTYKTKDNLLQKIQRFSLIIDMILYILTLEYLNSEVEFDSILLTCLIFLSKISFTYFSVSPLIGGTLIAAEEHLHRPFFSNAV